jgi:DNA-binding IclR family transcriptional regulator
LQRLCDRQIDHQESELDGRCVGAPIVGPDDRVIAAMSISAPVFRMNIDQAVSFVPQLKEACLVKAIAENYSPAAICSAISTVW